MHGRRSSTRSTYYVQSRFSTIDMAMEAQCRDDLMAMEAQFGDDLMAKEAGVSASRSR